MNRLVTTLQENALLLLISAGWFMIMGSRMVFPALLPTLKSYYSMDNTTAGLVMTVIWLSYAAFQFPSGLLADVLGNRRTLVVSLTTASASILILTLVPTLTGFFAGTVLFGAGSGLFTTPRVTLLTRSYSEKAGTALGISFAIGNIGTASLPFLAGLLAAHVAWQAGFLFLVPLFLGVGLGLGMTVRRSPSDSGTPEGGPGLPSGRAIGRAMMRPSILFSLVVFGMHVFTYQGFTAFLPIFLIQEKTFSQSMASFSFGLFFACGALFQFVVSSLTDRFPMTKVMIITAATAGGSLLSLALLGGFYPVLLCLLMVSCYLGLGPVVNRYLVAIIPEDVEGSVYGLIRTVCVFLGSTGSVVVGFLADRDLLQESFFLLGGLMVLMSALFLFLVAPEEA